MRPVRLGLALAFSVAASILSPVVASADVTVPPVRCVGSVAGVDGFTNVAYDYTTACTTVHSTVQAAVNAASPGALVLIGAGTYLEAVSVPTDRLHIRGVDRNMVVMKGLKSAGGQYDNAFTVTGRNVEVSNLTAYGYRTNGVYFSHTSGYTASYTTTYNNGRYGVYAFGTSGPGLITESYGSGHPDSAFYIGECNPCDALITNVTAVRNGLGYSGTNANGNLLISNSLWVDNGAGILPNTLDSEGGPPQCCIRIENNIVLNSGIDPNVPSTGSTTAAAGIGIGVTGGNENIIRDNLVSGSRRYGIVIAPYPEFTPNLYMPVGNRVTNNIVEDSTYFDLALAGGSGARNCFSGNSFTTSDPPQIELLYPCSPSGIARNLPVSGSASAAELIYGFATRKAQSNYLNEPAPAFIAGMPNPLAGF